MGHVSVLVRCSGPAWQSGAGLVYFLATLGSCIDPGSGATFPSRGGGDSHQLIHFNTTFLSTRAKIRVYTIFLKCCNNPLLIKIYLTN